MYVTELYVELLVVELLSCCRQKTANFSKWPKTTKRLNLKQFNNKKAI